MSSLIFRIPVSPYNLCTRNDQNYDRKCSQGYHGWFQGVANFWDRSKKMLGFHQFFASEVKVIVIAPCLQGYLHLRKSITVVAGQFQTVSRVSYRSQAFHLIIFFIFFYCEN